MSKQIRVVALNESHPAHCSRAQKFQKCYTLAVEELERELSFGTSAEAKGKDYKGYAKKLEKFNAIEFALQNCPESFQKGVQFGKFFPPDSVVPARVTIYRFPVQEHSENLTQSFEIIYDTVKSLISDYLKL